MSAVEEARALVAAASKRPWTGDQDIAPLGDANLAAPSGNFVLRGIDGSWIGEVNLSSQSKAGVRIGPQQAKANAQLTTVAVNTWLEILEALEATKCRGVYDDSPMRIVACGSTVNLMCGRCAALAHVAKELGERDE